MAILTIWCYICSLGFRFTVQIDQRFSCLLTVNFSLHYLYLYISSNINRLSILMYNEAVRQSPVLRPYTWLPRQRQGLEVIQLEYSLRLKIKRNDWLLVDTCPQRPQRDINIAVKIFLSIPCKLGPTSPGPSVYPTRC